VIRSFRKRAVRSIFEGQCVPGFSAALQQQARQRLAVLHAATSPEDLAAVPGNRLEKLHGDLAGLWSIRVNRQRRICFRWFAPDAYDVDLVDYH
jgi:proteic killer suppression protein